MKNKEVADILLEVVDKFHDELLTVVPSSDSEETHKRLKEKIDKWNNFQTYIFNKYGENE